MRFKIRRTRFALWWSRRWNTVMEIYLGQKSRMKKNRICTNIYWLMVNFGTLYSPDCEPVVTPELRCLNTCRMTLFSRIIVFLTRGFWPEYNSTRSQLVAFEQPRPERSCSAQGKILIFLPGSRLQAARLSATGWIIQPVAGEGTCDTAGHLLWIVDGGGLLQEHSDPDRLQQIQWFHWSHNPVVKHLSCVTWSGPVLLILFLSWIFCFG